MDDLRDLAYSISFNEDTKGLKDAINAENEIDKGLKDAAKSAKKMGTEFTEAGGKAKGTAKNTGEIGDNAKNSELSVKSLGKAIAGAYATKKVIDFGKAAINTFTDYEQSMANVHATMGNISNKDFDDLKKAARQAGATTIFSAKESADALNYLALAGYDTKTAIKALPDVLNLAIAGKMDLARASDLATDGLAAFGLEVKDLKRYNDELAKAAQKSNTNVQQQAEAILQAAGTAKGAGLSLEEMNTQLGILANRGKKGSEAGVALRNVLLNITAPQDNIADLFQQLQQSYGFIGLTDKATGKFRNFHDIIVSLNKSLGKFTPAQQQAIKAQIAGKENVQAFNAILEGNNKLVDGNKTEYEKLFKEISNANGTAKEFADTQSKTVKGAFKELQSAMEETEIALFDTEGASEGLQDFLRGLANSLPSISNKLQYFSEIVMTIFGFISDNKDTIISAIIGIGAALATWKMIGTVNKISQAIKDGAGIIKLFSNPVLLAVAAIAALVAGFVYFYRKSEPFRKKVNEITNVIAEMAQIFIENVSPAIDLFVSILGDLWNELKKVWDSFMQFVDDIAPSVMSIFDNLGILFNDFVENIIKPFAGFFLTIIWPIIKDVAMWIGDTFNNLWSTIGDVVAGIIKIIDGIIEFITGVFTGDWEKALEGIKKIFTGIWESIGGIFKGIVNGMVDGINFVIRGINSLANIKVPDWVPRVGGKGFELFSIPEIPHLAKGGTVHGDTLAQVNEEGGELRVLKDGTTVVPHDLSERYLNKDNSTGGIILQPSFQVIVSGAGNATDVAAEVDKQLRQQFSKFLNDAFGQLNIQLGYVDVEPSN